MSTKNLEMTLSFIEDFIVFKKEQTAEEGAAAVIDMIRKIYGIKEEQKQNE